MQRILDRAARFKKRAARKSKASTEHRAKQQAWEVNQHRVRLVREMTKAFRADRQNRRIDWETGALAPRRDVGDLATTYGAMSAYNFMPPEKPRQTKLKEEDWKFKIGDRVVMMRGRDRGRIGEVLDIEEDRNALSVRGLNMIDVVLPRSVKEENRTTDDLQTVEQMVDYQDVRLVYPLPDSATGIPRDVVIESLELRDAERSEYSPNEKPERYRVISGTNTIIPWPKAPPEDDPEDYDADTLRITVEERTFRHTLVTPPMPNSVIDELRNKYSPTRTRHDYDYIQKKEAEAAKEEGRMELYKVMRTPLQELAALREKKKLEAEAEARKELSREQLAKIGEVIAQEQGKMQSQMRVGSV